MDYAGSVQHKAYPSPAGAPGLLTDKAPCPAEIAYGAAAEVLLDGIRAALERGWCSRQKDGDFPRYVWGRSLFPRQDGASVEVSWEARVTNQGLGTYKAYPISQRRHASSMPDFVRDSLWP